MAKEPSEKLNKKQKKLQLKKKEKKFEKSLNSEELAVKQAYDKKIKKEEKINKIQKKKQNKRNILFIGNLSYKTTLEQIIEHFKACQPDIRLRKGFAFAEFTGNEATKRLNIALRLHHTTLDGRKINVELTAGGGGNSKARHSKLKERNERLNEERDQRKVKESNEKKIEKKTEVKGGGNPMIHPSRLKQMNHGS